MCGIAGFWDRTGRGDRTDLVMRVRAMAEAVVHRGPDDAGHWIDQDTGLALGHSRLAVVDPSARGHQPMMSATGRYVVSFNGEIYNFPALRRELTALGNRFEGGSDTEVLLAAIEQWGLERALERFTGMFAFALWDRRRTELLLCRDRLGEKPIYYGWSDGVFLFGSELKALRSHPSWRGRIDRDALALYLKHSNVPAPRTIYAGYYKLRPGSFVRIASETTCGSLPEERSYWTLQNVVIRGRATEFEGSDEDAIAELDAHLARSIERQLVADVPVGAFLSGGVDSSTVVAMMQAQRSEPVRTFSIGFREGRYDETSYARGVSAHLRTSHTEWIITPDEARRVIPDLSSIYDEPFADSSQIPTILVSRLAREHVTVSLSGDGADEVFGGYDRYGLGARIWRGVGWIPPAARTWLAAAVGSIPRAFFDSKHGSTIWKHRVAKLCDTLESRRPIDLYDRLMSDWPDPTDGVVSEVLPSEELRFVDPCGFRDLREWMMYLDTLGYLPDTILTKVDRAAMAVGLETRVPMLDHAIVEFAWRLPMHLRIRRGQSKWILRQVLYRYLPRTLVDRPKMGFGVPVADWLRGPLRDWAEDLLDERRLQREGYFRAHAIRDRWREHLCGSRNRQYSLWPILMFQSWMEASATTSTAPTAPLLETAAERPVPGGGGDW
jgi:asparagine synthase (glutamine-hydrolysing)